MHLDMMRLAFALTIPSFLKMQSAKQASFSSLSATCPFFAFSTTAKHIVLTYYVNIYDYNLLYYFTRTWINARFTDTRFFILLQFCLLFFWEPTLKLNKHFNICSHIHTHIFLNVFCKLCFKWNCFNNKC